MFRDKQGWALSAGDYVICARSASRNRNPELRLGVVVDVRKGKSNYYLVLKTVEPVGKDKIWKLEGTYVVHDSDKVVQVSSGHFPIKARDLLMTAVLEATRKSAPANLPDIISRVIVERRSMGGGH